MNRGGRTNCLIRIAGSALVIGFAFPLTPPPDPHPKPVTINARCGQPDYRRAHPETCHAFGGGGGGSSGGLLGGLLGGLGL